MRAKITTKPTKLKVDCMLCGKEVVKGEICIRCVQIMYPGYRVGYICKRHIKDECISCKEINSHLKK